MPAAWEYEQAVNNVSNWFNTSADNVWANINQYNLTPEQVQGILPTVDTFLYGQGANSGYTAVKAADGSVLSWNNVAALQSNSANAVEQAVNSNAGTISQKLYQLPATTGYGGTGGSFNATKGVSGGISGAVNVMSQVGAGVAAAGLGIKLGKAIDSTLYNLNPDFWDNNGMASLNPETWNSITVDMSDSGWEGTLKRAFNAVFGLDPNTGKSQMYLDADAAAYLAMYMQEKGVFPAGSTITSNWSGIEDTLQGEYYHYYNNPLTMCGGYSTIWHPEYENQEVDIFPQNANQRVFVIKKYNNNDQTSSFYSRIFIVSTTTPIINRNGADITVPISGSYVIDGITYNVFSSYRDGSPADTYYRELTPQIGQVISYSEPLRLNSTRATDYEDIARILYKGAIHESGGDMPEGISNQEGATQPDFSGCETPADYKQALQTQYPDLFNNAITQNVAQPDGTVVQKVYIPVGTPTATGTQDPQTTTDPQQSGQSQSDTEVDPTTATQTLIETLTKYIENIRTPDTPDTPNPPDTGDGNTPPVVSPTGSASALWTVYNPSQAQLNSFGAWLWSSNFIDQVLKLFNNPMQSIIGVHKIFASPTISGTNNITVGYLDSGVSSNVVGAQYTTIDCGTVNVREQFGNVFDYEDTQIRLYLPFIGIVPLDTNDAMRGNVQVIYHVDVITGACLAEVKITRDGGGGTLYQFAGDAAVRYPISSGSYMGVVSGVLGVVGGIASGIMSGGATLPMAAGAIAGGMSQAKTQVQHSGSFAGNAGAMGGKKPYMIIERPQTAVADGYRNYQGKGSNRVASVGDMSGYFKMTDIHTASIVGASEAEIASIVQALESGAIA